SVLSSTAVICVVSESRLMNSIAASTMPISTATGRSMPTVRPNVARNTALSLRGERGEEHLSVAAPPAEQPAKLAPLPPVVGDLHQNGAQRGQRNEFRERRRNQ